MSADPPADYVDGGYRASLLNTGAERIPILEMKGGLRAARRQVNRLQGDQRRVGGDEPRGDMPHGNVPPAPPPSEKEHNVPPAPPAPTPSEDRHNVPPAPPVGTANITKEEFYGAEGNKYMTYDEFMGQLGNCGELLGQLTVECTIMKEIMYAILFYRLANMVQVRVEGVIEVLVAPKARDYMAEDLLVILQRLQELLRVEAAAESEASATNVAQPLIQGDISGLLSQLSGLTNLLGSIRATAGPERTLASPALDILVDLRRLLEVLNISRAPEPASVPDTVSVLERLRGLLTVPGAPAPVPAPAPAPAPMPAVLDQLNRLLGLLGQASPRPEAVITAVNNVITPLNTATVTRLPSADSAVANELYSQLQRLITLLLNVQPRDDDAQVINRLQQLSRLLEGVRAQVVTPRPDFDAVTVIEQLGQIRRLLEGIESPGPVAAATIQTLSTQLDGLQRAVAANSVRRVQDEAGRISAAELLQRLERLAGLLEGVDIRETAPRAIPEGPQVAADAVEGPQVAADAVEGPQVAADAVEGPQVAADAVEGPQVVADAVEEVATPLPEAIEQLSENMKESINSIIKSPDDKEDIYDIIKRIIIRTLHVKNNLIKQISDIRPEGVSNIIIKENNLYNASTPERKLTRIEKRQRINKLRELLTNYSGNLIYNNVVNFNNINELIRYINACLYFNSFLIFLTKTSNENIRELTSIKSIIDYTINQKLKKPIVLEEKLE